MQPHRRGTRASVEAESKRPMAWVANIILGVSDVENAGFRRAVFKLQQNRAGRRRVFDFLSADLQGMLGLNDFFLRSWRLLFFFRLFRGLILRRCPLLGKAQIRSQEPQSDSTQIKNLKLPTWRDSPSK